MVQAARALEKLTTAWWQALWIAGDAQLRLGLGSVTSSWWGGGRLTSGLCPPALGGETGGHPTC